MSKLTGSFIVGSKNTVSITLKNDVLTEGIERLRMTLNGLTVSSYVDIRDTSNAIVISSTTTSTTTSSTTTSTTTTGPVFGTPTGYTYCVGTELWARYHNGRGGTFDLLSEYNSPACGFRISTTTTSTTTSSTTTSTTTVPPGFGFNAIVDIDIKILTVNQPSTNFRPVRGTGGSGSYGYKISPTLPSGLNLNYATGYITGSVTAVLANRVYTIVVEDIGSTSGFLMPEGQSRLFNLSAVNFAVIVTSDKSFIVNFAIPTFTLFNVLLGGVGPFTFGISPSNLPNGLSINITNGEISGTPLELTENRVITAIVTDSNSMIRSATFKITIRPLATTTTTTTTSTTTTTTTTTSTTTTTTMRPRPPEPVMSWSVTDNTLSMLLVDRYISRPPSIPLANCTVISGNLPPGLTLSNIGVLSGSPVVSNKSSLEPIKNYRFTANLLIGTENVIRTYSISVIDNLLTFDQVLNDKLTIRDDRYIYLIQPKKESYPSAVEWRLRHGLLPPNARLTSDGHLEVNTNFRIYNFTRNRFIKSDRMSSALSQAAWDSWLAGFIAQNHQYDYQFLLELSDINGIVHEAHSFRIIHTLTPIWSDWFYYNDRDLNYNPAQLYFLILSTEKTEMNWITNSNIGTVINGTISEKSVKLESNLPVEYMLKPYVYSRIPQGTKFISDGSLIGRVSFRCHVDDPTNLPINDRYEFTVRAYGYKRLTYTEKRFSLVVQRQYSRPSDDLYIYAAPPPEQRLQFANIIKNENIVPTKLLYRPNDPRFGRNTTMFFLFATGLKITSLADYETKISDNHYTKTLLFGPLHVAKSLNQNGYVDYEAVYIEMIDSEFNYDNKKLSRLVPPNIIDLRGSIKNYYVKNNQSYYFLQPNGLQNMLHVIYQSVGFENQGIVPGWMSSIQNLNTDSSTFYRPTGMRMAIVLAYIKPGHGELVMNNLRNITWNNFNFVFDRYRLDTSMTDYYNVEYDGFIKGSRLTTFDNGGTIFDSNSTRLVENMEYYVNPDFNHKYIKFPKAGVFR